MKKIILCFLFSTIILGVAVRTDGEENKNPTASKWDYASLFSPQKPGNVIVCTIKAFKKEDYAALFPPPLKGWKASEVRVRESVIEELEALSLFGEAPKRLQLERIYSGLNHPGKLSIALDSYDAETSAWISVVQKADQKSKQELKKKNIEPFSYKSYPGLRMVDEKNRLIGIVLNMTSSGCFGITVETPAGKTDAKDYLNASDLPKILAFLERHYPR